jgi:hypothetical protein
MLKNSRRHKSKGATEAKTSPKTAAVLASVIGEEVFCFKLIVFIKGFPKTYLVSLLAGLP